MAEEQLILVDESNRATGVAGKTAVHQRRAAASRVLDLHRRRARANAAAAAQPAKYHSGGLWANSCCGHPRPGERTVTAARRRLGEELGFDSPLSFGFFARYRTELDHGMHENEFVYVYFGRLHAPPRPDPAEVANVECLSVDEIGRRLRQKPDAFAVWFQHYFRRHRADIARLAKKASSSRRRA